jgi:HlyD family secretion protein
MRISVPYPRTHDRGGVARPARRRWRWLLLPFFLLLIGGVVFWRLRSSSASTATTSATVSQGTLTLAVSGSGSVAAARTVDLAFQQAGTVTSVNVKVGDQVTAGQALAQIDASDLQLQLQQAQANLKAAEAKLAQAKNGSATPQDLASAQASVEATKAQLAQTTTGTATKSDIQSAQAQLDAAQAKLDALKNPSAADLSAAQTQLAQAQTNLTTQRDSLSQAKTSAYNQMQQAVDALTQAQSKYATAKKNWDYVQETGADPTNPKSTNPTTGKTTKNKLSDTQRQQYYDTYVQAEAALHSAETAVQQAQVSYDTARQNEAAQLPLLEQQVSNAQAQLDALKNPTASALTQAQAAVTQAQASLTKLKQGGTAAEIAQAKAQVTQAQASLDSLTAPAAAPDLTAAEASLLQAQADVATAQHNLDEATLKAPFDAVVSAVAIVPGASSGASSSSSSTSSSSAAITLVDRTKLHIEVNLSEADAAKVQIGQPVTLTFDALPNVTLTGTVATIAPSATTTNNVVTYPVQVEFDPGQTPVKVGMSATADIQVRKVDTAILVPSRAVQTSGKTKTVTLLQGPQRTPMVVPVTTGITSDGQTEITSSGGNGAPMLKAGDLVALPSTTTSTTTSSTQNRGGGFGGFGGGPGGGPPPGGP